MTATQVVQQFRIVDIYRQCKVCGELKPHHHFEMKYSGHSHGKPNGWQVVPDRHICAVCRRRES